MVYGSWVRFDMKNGCLVMDDKIFLVSLCVVGLSCLVGCAVFSLGLCGFFMVRCLEYEFV